MNDDVKNVKFFVKAEWDDQTIFDLKQVAYWIANRIYVDLEDEHSSFLSDREYLYRCNFPNNDIKGYDRDTTERMYLDKVDKYLEEAKAKLFLHIKNRDLVFQGARLKKYICEDPLQWRDRKNFVMLDDTEDDGELNPDDIHLEGISIEDSYIYSPKGAYIAYLEKEYIKKLFEIYPPMKNEEFDIHVTKHSGVCFISAKDFKKINPYYGEFFYPEKEKDYLTSKEYYSQSHAKSRWRPYTDDKESKKTRGAEYRWEEFLQKMIPDVMNNPNDYKFINKKDFENKIQNKFSKLMNDSAPSTQAIRAKLDTLYKGLNKDIKDN